jgi:hypothetical protein
VAADRLRDIRIAVLLVWFGLWIHRCFLSGDSAETPHAQRRGPREAWIATEAGRPVRCCAWAAWSSQNLAC